MRGAGWRARATWRNEDALGMFGGGASGPDGETRSRRGERERLRGARPTNRVWSVYIGYSCIIAKSEETTTQKRRTQKALCSCVLWYKVYVAGYKVYMYA